MKKAQLESHLLVLVTLALVAFGLVMVYSSTSAPAALARTDPMSYLKKQGVYALIGVALMMSASRFDYRRLRLLAPALVLTALGGCLAVLVIGSRINGARRWIELGPATFQPSELAKLALAVWASAYLCKRLRRGRCASCGARSDCCSPSSACSSSPSRISALRSRSWSFSWRCF